MKKELIKAAVATVVMLAVVIVAAVLWLFALQPSPGNRDAADYSDDYHDALQQLPGSEQSIDTGLRRFSRVYAGLAEDDIGERIQELYAPRLYFNDVLRTFRDVDTLADYMTRTSRQLDSSSVRVDQVVVQGPDAFVRWTMEFRTSLLGRPFRSESIGMTHLRFDEAGRIVLHQDFWDSANGLYRHLPIIGPLLAQADAWRHR